MNPSDHIMPGAKCAFCKRAKATALLRLVARDEGMDGDALLYGAAVCWPCVRTLGTGLQAARGTADVVSAISQIGGAVRRWRS